MNEDHRWFCGGTILNQYIILTAAHCMNETRYFYIKLGTDILLLIHTAARVWLFLVGCYISESRHH